MKTSYTVFETIGNINLQELADDELEALIKNFTIEKERRENKERENDWLKVQQALSDYLEKYHEIRIECCNDTIWMTKDCIDTSEIGVINCY